MESRPIESAKHCPADWHLAQDARDGTHYCAPTNPAAIGTILGHSLAIPGAIVVLLVLRSVRRWYRAHQKPQ
jgi:hypothetical protein